ncbi:MAG: flagellar basal body-associated FliL family protein [Pseudomonadota bacterium]
MAEDLDEDIEDAEGEDAEGGEKKRDIKKLALFAGLPALVVILGGVAAALFFLGGDDDAHLAEGEAADEHGEADDQAHLAQMDENPIILDLPEMLVNIDGGDGRTTYLKLNLAVQVSDEAMAEVLDARMPLILNQYQTFLRELRLEDLSGSAGTHRLRLELLRRINIALAPSRVDAVLIEDMLIQ